MKKLLILTMLLLVLTVLLAACKGGTETPDVTDPAETTGTPEDTKVPDTQPVTDPATEGETGEPAPETQPETQPETEPETEPVPELNLSTSVRFTEAVLAKKKTIFSGANQCEFDLVPNPDDEGNYMLKLTTKGTTVNDPFIGFSFTKYLTAVGAKKISADDYKYVAIKLKAENMSNGNFELFYCAGSVSAPSGDAFGTTSYDNSDEGWQYILFDLSRAKWSGNITQFRLDFTTNAQGGETMYISAIEFLKTEEEFYKLIGFDPESGEDEYVETPEQKALIDKLLSAADSSLASAFHSYQGEKAPNESADLTLGFKSMTDRTAKADNSDKGAVSYLLRLAKNEIEGMQAVLFADKDMKGLKLYVTDFENKDGVKLTTDLLWGYYFTVEGEEIVDPLPPVKYAEDLQPGDLDWNNGGNHGGGYIVNYQKYNGFDIKAGQNQTFVIKAHTTKDTPAGEYTALVTVKDAEGRIVKQSKVFAWVWSFALPEAPTCKTLADISWFAVYSNHLCFNGDNGYLYQLYYDYLLENGICGYDIPYNNKNGDFSDSRVLAYLNNPRVTAFQAMGWKQGTNNSQIYNADAVARAYNFLSQDAAWLAKSYFYPIDEPYLAVDPQILNKINQNGIVLRENFPGYKLIVPMHVNGAVAGGDYFSYVSESVTAWCPHTFFFNTFNEYLTNRKLTYRMSAALEKKLGTFPERMAKEQEGGDEVWWYVTRFPQEPEITLTMNTAAINYRLLFWQQKLYNVDGFLYYSVTDWFQNKDFMPTIKDFPGYDGPIAGDGAPYVPRPQGLNEKHETDNSYPFNVYGNGVLVYTGQYFGVYGPVGCYRLECVRDGIEDFDYLSMLVEKYGKETVDLLICRLSTSLSKYTTDEAYFNQVRNALGNLLENPVEP